MSETEAEEFWERYGDEIVDHNCFYALQATKKCPFCATKLAQFQLEFESPQESWTQVRRYSDTDNLLVKFCRNCKHWFGSVNIRLKDFYTNSAVSVAREFEGILPHEVHDEVAQYFRRHPSFYNTVSPIEFEKFVASVYRANFKNVEVKHVGGSGDLGVDVILIFNDDKQWLVQVKRRGDPNGTEGFETIQKMAGTMLLKGVPDAVVVSTANKFSAAAKLAIKSYKQRGYKIQLVDKGVLNDMVQDLLPKSPWIQYIQSLEEKHIITPDVKAHILQSLSRLE